MYLFEKYYVSLLMDTSLSGVFISFPIPLSKPLTPWESCTETVSIHLSEIRESGEQVQELELVAYTFLSETRPRHFICYLYVLVQYSRKEDSGQRAVAMYMPISR